MKGQVYMTWNLFESFKGVQQLKLKFNAVANVGKLLWWFALFSNFDFCKMLKVVLITSQWKVLDAFRPSWFQSHTQYYIFLGH